MMEKDFLGKSVIVTGSSSGIGEEIAILFARRGANVTLCGRDKERLEMAREKCRQASSEDGKVRYITVCGDVNSAEVQEAIVKNTVDQFGKLDVLVCNHGIVVLQSNFLEVTEQDYDAVFNTNLKSIFFLIQKAVPYLQKTKGSIINMSSIASTKAPSYFIPYSMGKAGMDHMTRCLALDLASKGIRVNAVNPTLVETNIFKNNTDEFNKIQKNYKEAHPLGGRESTVTEQAEAVLLLASERAGFITGECLKVDGGVSLVWVSLDK